MKKSTILLCSIFTYMSFLSFSQTPIALKLDSRMALKKINSNGTTWYNPKRYPFQLVGFEWIKQDSVYRRLPVHSEWKLSKAVENLANHTAGGQVRFKTNSKRILVNVNLAEASGMYHMPATGQSGFDLYVLDNGLNRYIKTTRFPVKSTNYTVEIFTSNTKKMRSFTLNFPLYNGVNSLQIGLDTMAVVKAPNPFKIEGKFVIYGTSITQGGCVSRPGMAYSNIISRNLDVQFINLGFSGNGKGEPELAHLINQIKNVRLIILDYEPNATETIINTLEPFIDIIREQHSDVPILIMSHIRYAEYTNGSELYKRLLENRDFQQNLVDEKKATGDTNIYFLDGSKVLGDDYYECMVDGAHPSDLGSKRIADALIEKIRFILSKK